MFNINVLVAFNWVQIQDNAGQGTHSNDVKEVEQKQLINQKVQYVRIGCLSDSFP